MEYAVDLTLRAGRDLDELFEYLNASNSPAARRWFNGLEKAIYSLQRFPRRCSRAREARKASYPIRQLLYGKKPDVYRVLYEIEELTRTVRVLAIRHGARDEWKPVKTSLRRV
jgi:plasmid stabilization system protein ParE